MADSPGENRRAASIAFFRVRVFHFFFRFRFFFRFVCPMLTIAVGGMRSSKNLFFALCIFFALAILSRKTARIAKQKISLCVNFSDFFPLWRKLCENSMFSYYFANGMPKTANRQKKPFSGFARFFGKRFASRACAETNRASAHAHARSWVAHACTR